MARKTMRAAAKKKLPAAVETSASIEEQTQEFLHSGNKISVIQSGISGQPSLAAVKQANPKEKTAAS
jgi:hypothetical protein